MIRERKREIFEINKVSPPFLMSSTAVHTISSQVAELPSPGPLPFLQPMH